MLGRDPIRWRGVSTCKDGSVVITIPMDECVHFLMHGGGIDTDVRWRWGLMRWLYQVHTESATLWLWADKMPIHVAKEWEAHKFVKDPRWRPDHTEAERRRLAERWVEALDRGGLSEKEAVALILEKDAPPYSTAHDIITVADLPDRTYRDAWRRSHNGGPIYIDIRKQIEIEENRTWEAYHGAHPA